MSGNTRVARREIKKGPRIYSAIRRGMDAASLVNASPGHNTAYGIRDFNGMMRAVCSNASVGGYASSLKAVRAVTQGAMNARRVVQDAAGRRGSGGPTDLVHGGGHDPDLAA